MAHHPTSRWLGLLLAITMLSAVLQTVAGAKSTKAQAKAATTTPRILVPLYIYPLPNAWDPLYTAIRANPTAAFTVIVNPNSGPGSGSAPDADYADAIRTLRGTAGAGQVLELVGYVPTGYAKRAATKVKADVATYANWPAAVRPDGVFFDETSTQSRYLAKYANYTDFVKGIKWSSRAATSARTGITVLNPGTWPQDARFWSTSADHIVVYEDKLSNFNYTDYTLRTSKNHLGTAFKRSYIFYNVDPNNATTKDAKRFTSLDALVDATVTGLSSTGGLFITNLDINLTDVYAKFSSIWQQFVKSVARLSR
ncbi:related to Spherulin 4 precursor [Sporisorium reilianum f. sp. reilianum]|uniref:Related to Spherulin 4 n=1 Tax=Sporisorium reilianum f. sp. reilianum TaxID=72559 RepID=A0A2N8UNT8_9BASI|nr:related to Spherulin 4 precursor [Sporisorium reilianum f. sp. reilianum]